MSAVMRAPLSYLHGQFPGGGGIVNLSQPLQAKQGADSVLVVELRGFTVPGGVCLQNSFEYMY